MNGRRRTRRGLSTILLGLLVAAAPVRAQVNVEKLRAFNTDGVGVSFDGTVALLAGNSDVIDLGLKSRLDVRRGRHYAFLIGSVRYGESNDVQSRERAFAHLRYNHDLTPRLIGEAFAQVEHDGFTLLQLRLLGGAGVRVRYLRAENPGVFQGSSIFFEAEEFDGARAGEHPASTRVWRWSNYLHLRLQLTDQTYLVNTVYVQPRFGAFGDVRVLDEAALAVALGAHLTFTAGFNLRYDSRPPGDVKPLDLALENGLSLTF